MYAHIVNQKKYRKLPRPQKNIGFWPFNMTIDDYDYPQIYKCNKCQKEFECKTLISVVDEHVLKEKLEKILKNSESKKDIKDGIRKEINITIW